MARWCYSMVLLLLVGCSISVPVDPYDVDNTKDVFEHDNMDEADRDEDLSATIAPFPVTRTTMTMNSLQCFNCSSRDDATCFAPSTNKTNVTTCATEGSKCFTTTVKSTTEMVVRRGCQEKCAIDNGTTCCEVSFCNSQVVRDSYSVSRRLNQQKNKSEKPLSQTVLFFVTVLLLLQTVVKVAFV